MAVTTTNLTVTIVTTTPGEEDLLLEAEIVAEDNNGESTYYVGETYYLRLFKSTNISSISYNSNIGTVTKGSEKTASVPYDENEPEYLVFTGGNTSDLDKVYESGFSYSAVGSIFDDEGNSTSASLSAPAKGAKTVKASKKIYGVFEVSYTTKYTQYSFRSGVVGQMLIFFIGSN